MVASSLLFEYKQTDSGNLCKTAAAAAAAAARPRQPGSMHMVYAAEWLNHRQHAQVACSRVG